MAEIGNRVEENGKGALLPLPLYYFNSISLIFYKFFLLNKTTPALIFTTTKSKLTTIPHT